MLSPVAAPTSYEGPFGKIIYRVRAAIDTSRFSKDYKAQRPFYLLNLLNLNEVPDIEVSVQCTNLTDWLGSYFIPLQTWMLLFCSWSVHLKKERTFNHCSVSPYLINHCLGRGLFDFMALLTYHSLFPSWLSEFPGSLELSRNRISAQHQLTRLRNCLQCTNKHLSSNSVCSIRVTLWPLRSSATSWWRRGPWCWKLAVTWEVTSLVRSSS